MACLKDNRSGLSHLLSPLCLIGSAAECQIRIEEAGVPPEHARVHFDRGAFRIEAARADAEVRVNGKKVRSALLSEGDVVAAAGREFVFTHFTAPGAPPPEGEGRSAALRSLYDFSLALMGAESAEALLQRLVEQLVSITGADKGFLVLREGEEYRIRAEKNIGGEGLADCSAISNSVIRSVTAQRRSILVSDAPGDTEFGAAQSILRLRLKSIIGAPILLKNELLGVIYLGSERAASLFDAEDLETVTVFASQAALMIKNIALLDRLAGENRNLRELLDDGILYESQTMENVLRNAVRIAGTTLAVLITGETGTGKELLAKEIHRQSGRRAGPFVTVNCSAIPENLVESELFGHKKGAFTGAVTDRKGRFEMAHGGTIFLDEIGDMPPAVQAKLLRVLETGELETVGEALPRKVDVRVVAATHKPLKDGDTFRKDLYYRLTGVEIAVPPLKARGMDSLVIARSMLEKYCSETKKRLTLSKEAEAAILKYGWPGNVRELRNRLLRAATVCAGAEIRPADLELGEGAESALLPLQEAKERFARGYIREILTLNRGSKTKAAQDLGIDARTIYRYLEDEAQA